MKGDFTRFTFDPKKHYSRVLMQQGRVQMDADWNEQQDLTLNRIETETVDVVGASGGPRHGAGFEILPRPVLTSQPITSVPQQSNITERAGLTGGRDELVISAGRYYVDGVLCENEAEVSYELQPGLADPNPITAAGTYLAYLDVWSRHITALDDAQIREVALGGPDTGTRAQTVWQMRLVKVADGTIACSTVSAPVAASGLLAARAIVAAPSINPCDVAPGAAYRRLENQLYRVEVHKGGPLGTATFKWSRDNGAVAASWEPLGPDSDKLTVSSIGRDKVLAFATGQWVELTDDARELLGQPGTLVRLANADGQVLTLDTATVIGTLDLTTFKNNRRVRRWEMDNLLKPSNSTAWAPLEDGVEVQFGGAGGSTFKTGDYWMIPARTATGDVEWPKDSADQPVKQLPHGVRHSRANLALLTLNNGRWNRISDCRRIFPPLTELTSFFYVGGDGQEAMPDLAPSISSPVDPPGAGGEVSTLRSTLLHPLTRLPHKIEVGVANGQWPVPGAIVRFSIADSLDGGELKGGAPAATGKNVNVTTDAHGVAACEWQLGPSPHSQGVEAVLLGDDGVTPLEIHPIHFNARLSVADHVAYDPKGCGSLARQTTVQDAIDTLAGLTSLYPVSGDNQSVPPETGLALPLVVVASNACGPVAGVKVRFTVVKGDGAVVPDADVTTDEFGMAECLWSVGLQTYQAVDAELVPIGDPRFVPPTKVQFTANVQSPVDPVFEVTDLLFITAVSGPLQPLRNDMVVSPSKLRNGIQIVFSEPVDSRSFISPLDQSTVKKPVCFVTLEVPFFTQLAGTTRALVGFQPIILDGTVGFGVVGSSPFDPTTTTQTPGEEILRAPTQEDHKTLNWIPNTTTFPVSTSDLFINSMDSLLGLLKGTKKTRLLCKLTLKSSYIVAEDAEDDPKRPKRYLDGEAFADLADSSNHGIRIPSGDHRPGGDLEVWFWLKKESVEVVPRILTFQPITGVGSLQSSFSIRNVGDEPFDLTGIDSTQPTVFSASIGPLSPNPTVNQVLNPTADAEGPVEAAAPLSREVAIQPIGVTPALPLTIGRGQSVNVTVTFTCAPGPPRSPIGRLIINTDPSVEAGEVQLSGTCNKAVGGGGPGLPTEDSADKNTRKKAVSPKKKPVAKKKGKPKH